MIRHQICVQKTSILSEAARTSFDYTTFRSGCVRAAQSKDAGIKMQPDTQLAANLSVAASCFSLSIA